MAKKGKGGGCLAAAAAVLALALVAAAGALAWLVLGGPGAQTEEPSAATNEGLAPRSFADYGWDELAEVAALVAAAPSDEEGLALAEEWDVGVGSVRTVELPSGTPAELRVVGVRHDERADGSGVAGLTLMLGPVALAPMNATATNAGGWEGSDLRAALAQGKGGLLPEGLAEHVVAVSKSTNNVGVTADADAVTQTADELWLFSASEVCGPLSWFSDEYGEEPTAGTGWVDFAPYDALLSAEGEQYAWFAESGVTGSSDPGHVLARTWGGGRVGWWYRTAYPYTFTGQDASFFYQVMPSGFPSSVGQADVEAGVCVGLCL